MSDSVQYCLCPEDVPQVVLTDIPGSKDPDYVAAPSFFFFQFHKPLQYFCFLFSCLFLPPLWCWFLPLPVERMGGREAGKYQEWGSCCVWPGQKLPWLVWAVMECNSWGSCKVCESPWCFQEDPAGISSDLVAWVLCPWRCCWSSCEVAEGAAVSCWHSLALYQQVSSLHCTNFLASSPDSITPTSVCFPSYQWLLFYSWSFSSACSSGSVTCLPWEWNLLSLTDCTKTLHLEFQVLSHVCHPEFTRNLGLAVLLLLPFPFLKVVLQ